MGISKSGCAEAPGASPSLAMMWEGRIRQQRCRRLHELHVRVGWKALTSRSREAWVQWEGRQGTAIEILWESSFKSWKWLQHKDWDDEEGRKNVHVAEEQEVKLLLPHQWVRHLQEGDLHQWRVRSLLEKPALQPSDVTSTERDDPGLHAKWITYPMASA